MSTKLLIGDARDLLKTLPDQSVHCVITSPPYYGLRDYGTATWEGGDSDCDHVVGAIRTGLGLEKLGERYAGGRHKAAEPKPMMAKGMCPKCGARRTDGQIGLEATPADYIAELVSVFQEVWRVLRDDGTVWLNLGDSYNNFRVEMGPGQAVHGRDKLNGKPEPKSRPRGAAGLKEKDLMMMPARVAIALQDSGWYVRSDCIWCKPNPMPESCTDRPTSSHEHIFLLAKSGDTTFWTHRDGAGSRAQPAPDYRWLDGDNDEAETDQEPPLWRLERSSVDPRRKRWRRVNLWVGRDYFYDAEAVREGVAPSQIGRERSDVVGGKSWNERNQHSEGGTYEIRKLRPSVAKGGFGGKTADQAQPAFRADYGSRNLRNVWTIATLPFASAHFATFPPDLVETCVRAGTSERGCCQQCGAPWFRRITKGAPDEAHRAASGADASGGYNGQSTKNHDAAGVQNASDVKRRILEGMREKTYDWSPTCGCDRWPPVPCTVLDPFMGAGTTGLVADRLGRDAIGIELNPDYAELARKRVVGDSPLFAVVT